MVKGIPSLKESLNALRDQCLEVTSQWSGVLYLKQGLLDMYYAFGGVIAPFYQGEDGGPLPYDYF